MGLFRIRAIRPSPLSDRHPPFQRPTDENSPAALRSQLAELQRMIRVRWQLQQQRTPELRQLEPTECAAICLAIVLRHHGLHRPISELRQACGVSRDGSSAAQLVRAARRYGLMAEGLKRGLQTLQDVPLPAVLFWEFNHFVVLEAIDPNGNGYWVNNPALGRTRLTNEEMDRGFTGVVLSMLAGPEFQPGGREPSRLLTLLRLMRRGRLRRDGSRWLQQKLLALPAWSLQHHQLNELSDRHQALRDLAVLLEQELLPTIAALVLLAAVAVGQTGAGVVIWPWILGGTVLQLLLLVWEDQLLHPLHNHAARLDSRQQHQLDQALEDPYTFKALSLEPQLLQQWSDHGALAHQDRRHLERLQRLSHALPQLLSIGLPILLIAALSFRPVGLLAGTIWWWSLERLRRSQQAWFRIGEDLHRLQALEEEPLDPWLLEPDIDPNTPIPSGAIAVSIKGLKFGHTPGAAALIANLHLTVKPGEILAISGPNGSGKSTLLQLMAGLLQPETGTIELAGRPLLHWSTRQRCQAIAMVSQDDALIEASVRDNLTLWNPSISDAEIIQEASALGLEGVLSALPQGLDTPLKDGHFNLSGGQRQLLNLTRALLQKPSLLLMDEATSALDAESERRVLQHLRSLNCTVVMVAHRSGSLRMAEQTFTLSTMNSQ